MNEYYLDESALPSIALFALAGLCFASAVADLVLARFIERSQDGSRARKNRNTGRRSRASRRS